MSGKLDKSLDEILVNRRQGARRRNRRSTQSKAAPAAVGGVKKSTKAAKPSGKAAQAGHPMSTESKIMVSGLEYFSKSAGPVKRVMLTYNQNGTSRGIASIVFSKPDTAAKAAKDLNGLLVDGRPMKVSFTPHFVFYRLSLTLQTKSQPKPATASKATDSTRGRGRRGGRRGPGPKSNRPKPKTVEELDAEMVDYFSNENAGPAEGNAPANAAAPQPANGGEDLGMAEISVSCPGLGMLEDYLS
ncbi:unnamed protein product [Aspergillus oryzae]|uniref:Unnamed protein product n=2 Tax=Aspergillus oryzae TaxID=5062 RepID=A0AAN4YP51_ASPOZ|nr:unnamed protein product [Aspergillus oryzae]GMF91568.1 unnamed protein product [Aspergillus oryzae]GMG13714.1 unnamed protein product [Aspergillus oryzae]GMG33454.1 unnamed protein product [Aspergillus oryzae]GMG54257.1 unnamed protein product [Aspergillus oryzae var. brunneus]